MDELAAGIRRLTLPLPTRPGHVHAYLLEGGTLVDTGLGLPDAGQRWAAALTGARVERIVVTHFHPDHVGAAADVAALTGAPVHQGALDYEQCLHVWGNRRWPHVMAAWFHSHGVPEGVTDELTVYGDVYSSFIRFVRDPELLRDGDELAGWRVVATPGHADGHLCLLRDGVLLAADHLLPRITPAVGLYPDSRPDPLADYLASLERVASLAPRIAYPGHGEPIQDPAGRARELVAHHARRLDETAAALGPEPRSGFEVSFPLFGRELSPGARRFAVAETLSHLVRLVGEGRAERVEDGGVTRWRRPPRRPGPAARSGAR